MATATTTITAILATVLVANVLLTNAGAAVAIILLKTGIASDF
jgi:hypothetical protein